MAIQLPDSECIICGLAILPDQEALGFPPFIGNESDALHIFNDSLVHASCLSRHPLRSQLAKALDEHSSHVGPLHRKCCICGLQIDHPDDFMGLGYLSTNFHSPLYRYNFKQFHCGCFKNWHELNDFARALKIEVDSGNAKGRAIERLLSLISAVDTLG